MVTVKNFHLREKEDGISYVSLELMGDLELVQSANTGRFYATARRCFIFSTFTEDVAQAMIGRTIPGTITRIPCESYEYVLPETGEVIQLAYRYDYTPEEKQVVSTPRSFQTMALAEN